MAILKIQPKLKVEKYIAQVEKIITQRDKAKQKNVAELKVEKAIAQIEKFIAQRDKAKQKNVAELKAEEKIKAQRKDWRKLIKMQKAWVKSNLN